MQSLVKLLNRRTGAKTAVVLLTITILVIAFASITTSAPEITYGDVNQDGKIDVRDVVLVMQYIIGLQDLTEDQYKAADVNGDGVVNVQDVTMIMRHVLNIETRSKAITDVEEVTINVFINNPADRLYFPSKVKATLSDDTVKELEVEWEKTSTPPYVKEEVGEYIFEGELVNLPWGISNPDGIKARAVVNVLMYDIPRLPTPVPGFDLFALTLMVDPPEAGSASGSGDYEEGDIIEVSLFEIDEDYEFVNWTWGEQVVSTDPTFEFVMPSENIILTANLELADHIVGGIVFSAKDLVYSSPAEITYFSPAEYVYSTEWTFELTYIPLDDGQTVTIDLNDDSLEGLVFSEYEGHYDISNFTVDASDAQDQDDPKIVLTADDDISEFVEIDITVYVGVKAAIEPDSTFTVRMIRDDSGKSDLATFGIAINGNVE